MQVPEWLFGVNFVADLRCRVVLANKCRRGKSLAADVQEKVEVRPVSADLYLIKHVLASQSTRWQISLLNVWRCWAYLSDWKLHKAWLDVGVYSLKAVAGYLTQERAGGKPY
jgi:HJR/Mrr/RecB family endonuclease